jgi:hypothetical protein
MIRDGYRLQAESVRGKRLVYRSTDPEEPKREIVRVIRLLVVSILWLLAIFLWPGWLR